MSHTFKGYVVQFANDPRYHGLDAYLHVNFTAQSVDLCYSLETATLFHDKEAAQNWATKSVGLRTASHALPEVRPVWQETRRTLTDPNPRQQIMDVLKEVKSTTPRRRLPGC